MRRPFLRSLAIVNPLRLLSFDNAQVLAEHADRWNDLWRRSDTYSPSARAEQVALWLAQFAPRQRFRALVVAEGERWLAALPLVAKRVKHLVRVGALPQNEWTSGGDLLVDPAADVPAALDLLCQGIADFPWPLVWLDDVALEAPRWSALRAALERAGMAYDLAPQGQVAQVAIAHDWAAYEATRDGDHRRSRRRYTRKLQEAGGGRFELLAPREPAEVDRLVRQAFEVEDRSWKGAEGTSVIKAGLLDFYQRQARALAAEGLLELAFLMLGDSPIAFAYGWRSKGAWLVAKLGYDENHRQFGPGQQLVMALLEQLQQRPEVELLDFWGPLASWNESWATRVYDVGRLVVAPQRAISRGLLHAYESLRNRRERQEAS